MTSGPKAAKDLGEGDRVDFDPEAPFITEANSQCARYEYASVQSVNGGWADAMAPAGHIVLYTDNFVEPIILPADTIVHVERWH
jgi:hypothetical protein